MVHLNGLEWTLLIFCFLLVIAQFVILGNYIYWDRRHGKNQKKMWKRIEDERMEDARVVTPEMIKRRKIREVYYGL